MDRDKKRERDSNNPLEQIRRLILFVTFCIGGARLVDVGTNIISARWLSRILMNLAGSKGILGFFILGYSWIFYSSKQGF